jgi:hypothetical protein
MKLQTTIVLTFQASSLAEAGGKLDDVLARARERDDIEVASVEVHTPVGTGPVSLPHVGPPAPPPERLPRPIPA